MTRRNYIIKWLTYTLVFLVVLVAETMILNRITPLGVAPMLMPLAVVCVAVLEGPLAGAGFGVAVGLAANFFYHSGGSLIVFLPLAATAVGFITRYLLKESFAGAFLCSLGTLVAIDIGRSAFYLLVGRAQVLPVLLLAAGEILWSLVFVLPVYLFFRWAHNRIGGSYYF